jgi:hypothetical protein
LAYGHFLHMFLYLTWHFDKMGFWVFLYFHEQVRRELKKASCMPTLGFNSFFFVEHGLVHSWNIFDARTHHGQTRIYKIHHGPDLGKPLTHSQLLEGLKCESKRRTVEEGGVEMRSLAHNTWRGRGACWSSGMGLGRIDKLIHSHGPAHKPHKVISA